MPVDTVGRWGSEAWLPPPSPVAFITSGSTVFGTNWNGGPTLINHRAGDRIIAMQTTNSASYYAPSSTGVTFTQLGLLFDGSKTVGVWSGLAPSGWSGYVRFDSGSFSLAGSVGVFRNVDSVESFSGPTALATTTTPTIPSGTTTRDGGMAVAVAGYVGSVVYTSPSGWTTGGNPLRGTGDLGWSYKALPVAGPSGDCVPTLASSLTTSVSMAILRRA